MCVGWGGGGGLVMHVNVRCEHRAVKRFGISQDGFGKPGGRRATETPSCREKHLEPSRTPAKELSHTTYIWKVLHWVSLCERLLETAADLLIPAMIPQLG